MFWRTFIIIFLGVLNLALFSRMIWGPTGIVEYRNLKTRLSDLREKIVTLDAENRSLSREIRLLQSDGKYMEKMVRQKLHYLRDNEIVYIFDQIPAGNAGGKTNERKN